MCVLKQMKEKSVNLIFADAPYNIGKNFGNNSDRWENVGAYIDWCRQWIDECMRILKDDGTMYFMTALGFSQKRCLAPSMNLFL